MDVLAGVPDIPYGLCVCKATQNLTVALGSHRRRA